MAKGSGKESVVILGLLVLAGAVVLYYTQSGAPDTSGATDVAGDLGGAIRDNAPAPGDVVRGAGEGAEKAADETAKVTNEASKYPKILGSLAAVAILAYLWRKNKVFCIAGLAVLATIVIMSQR